MPDGYTPRMNHWGVTLSARISRDGWLFEISEESDGMSGGWMASCIPPYTLHVPNLSVRVAGIESCAATGAIRMIDARTLLLCESLQRGLDLDLDLDLVLVVR